MIQRESYNNVSRFFLSFEAPEPRDIIKLTTCFQITEIRNGVTQSIQNTITSYIQFTT